MHWGFHLCFRVWELVCTDLKGTLRTFAEASLVFKDEQKASAESDKVLITLAPQMC